jgi:hypothetical protein
LIRSLCRRSSFVDCHLGEKKKVHESTDFARTSMPSFNAEESSETWDALLRALFCGRAEAGDFMHLRL